ncbi:MAG: aspartate aminotransferase family protein [Pseudomonadota bacterium]|nr:aspartate aminotransferase family protein [Pseudomonadota bacterium]
MVTTVMPTYGRIDIAFDRGEGSYLYATDGRRFLDFASGIATNSLGHAHPHLVKMVQEQAAKLWHVSNLYHIPEQQRLADRLCENSFANTVFFCNSGAEAMEGALKVARKYHFANGEPKRERVIACSRAFHGRTLATLSAGDSDKYREGFGPRPGGFEHVPFGNLNEVRAAMGDDVAAIVIEPVQGEGGIFPADYHYLHGLRAAADEFGALLVFDEVQCGMGRTGKLWAYEWAGVAPDVMALAKGLGGGFPVGAVLATEKAASGMVPGTHGSTYGGNPMACAAANAVLDVMLADGFLDQVIARGEYLHSALAAVGARHPGLFEEIRGKGLMVGLKGHAANTEIWTRLRDHGLLVVGAGDNALRLLPPLTVSESEIDEAMAAIEAVAGELEAAA